MNVFEWLESTSIARAISGSLIATASLSAAHLLGFTLVSGAAFALHLRLAGAMLRRAALADVVQPAGRLIALGLTVSAATGGLLFAGRATSIAANAIFQTKMSLLLIAVGWQLAIHYRLARPAAPSPQAARAIGLAGFALWLGLAVTACAFILLE